MLAALQWGHQLSMPGCSMRPCHLPATNRVLLFLLLYHQRSFSFGVVLWELLTWRLPWAGSGLSPFQVGGWGKWGIDLACANSLLGMQLRFYFQPCSPTQSTLPRLRPQIGAKVVAGERLELPPREALPGPDTAAFAGLDAYCALIQECWAAQPEQRPGMAQVVRRLRGLLEQCGGGAAAATEQAAGGGESV